LEQIARKSNVRKVGNCLPVNTASQPNDLQLNQQRPAKLKPHNIRKAIFYSPLKLVLSSLDENGNEIC